MPYCPNSDSGRHGSAALLLVKYNATVISCLGNCKVSWQREQLGWQGHSGTKLKLKLYRCSSSYNYETLLLKTNDLLACCLGHSELLVFMRRLLKLETQTKRQAMKCVSGCKSVLFAFHIQALIIYCCVWDCCYLWNAIWIMIHLLLTASDFHIKFSCDLVTH